MVVQLHELMDVGISSGWPDIHFRVLNLHENPHFSCPRGSESHACGIKVRLHYGDMADKTMVAEKDTICGTHRP